MTAKRMDEMEIEIKRINRKVNFLIVISAIGTFVTIAKMLLALPSYAPHSPIPTNTNSVQIGAESKEKPQREFLNSDEVGEREGVTSRTVISWIEQGRIEPQPTRNGRAWIIAADYKILPQITLNKQQN